MSLKQKIYDQCKEIILDKIRQAEQAIGDLQEAKTNESKSSAGDKYETSREMMQQEMDRELARLYELKKQKAALDIIDPARTTPAITAGSLVKTDQGKYFLSVNLGVLKIEDVGYQAISPAAPLGSRLLGRKTGDAISFRDRLITILEVS